MGDRLNRGFPCPTTLADYHPVIVEGMGGADRREPGAVSEALLARLDRHWQDRPIHRPPIVVIQGDPLAPRGISAITRRVAEGLETSRALVCLDEAIADYHARDADRHNVSLEFRYSQMAGLLGDCRRNPRLLEELEAAIETRIEAKNAKRHRLGKPPLKSWVREFALLQEVTKAACRAICGDITIAHTSPASSEFSVTGFYEVGITLGAVDPQTMVGWHEDAWGHGAG